MRYTWNQLNAMNAEQIKALQRRSWSYFSQHILPYQPFFMKQLKLANLSLADVASLDSLHRLPFSGKKDILPSEAEPTKPRDFILQPNEKTVREYMPKLELLGKVLAGGKANLKRLLQLQFKPIHIHFTTGRSSAQIPFFYSQYDLDNLAEAGRRIVATIGASPDEIVVNAFPFAPHLAFWQAYMASTASGLLAIQSGGGKILGTEKIIASIPRMKATILIVMPGYGYHLLREAIARKADFSSLKFIVLGGERVNPGLREKMKEMLAELGAKQVKILSTYAMTEGKAAWVQCHERSGYHLYPDLEYIEIIDEAGEQVAPGQPGEIVYTGLDWRGSVVVRYKTGDICKGLTTEPCQYCGRSVPQLSADIERKSENVDILLTKVKGELVNLNTFHALTHQVKGIDEWQVQISKKNNDPNDLDELYLHISLLPNSTESVTAKELSQLIQNEMSISPIVRVHSRAELVEMLGLETSLKEKRIVDLRKSL